MYKSLDKKAITVMRINALIGGVITLLIVLIALYFCLTNFEDNFSKIIVISVASIIGIIILLDIFLFPIIRYNRYKYLITDDKIEVKKGLFLITRTIIQIKRVQKIEISDGPIDRKFSLASVNIYTAAGVADIKFLNKNEAEKITEEINNILKKNLEKNYEN